MDSGDLVLDGAPSGETPELWTCPACGCDKMTPKQAVSHKKRCAHWRAYRNRVGRSVREIPPAISEALQSALDCRENYGLEMGLGSPPDVLEHHRGHCADSYAALAAILSALPREEPQTAPQPDLVVEHESLKALLRETFGYDALWYTNGIWILERPGKPGHTEVWPLKGALAQFAPPTPTGETDRP